MTMLVVGLVAVAAQAVEPPPTVHYSFDETASGTWDVSAEIIGADTSGLSAYGIWVYIDPALVSYTENTLGTLDAASQPIGFLSSTLVSGDVAGNFNAGNYQNSGASSIPGIGMVPVYQAPPVGVPAPPVDLGVPALLGTLSTPAGLGAADFAPDGAALLNIANDGFIAAIITMEVNPIPEPATLALLAIGGLAMLRRRRS